MAILNTKPSYEKLTELYHKALNDNRLMKAKHDKEIAGYKARNSKLENEINRLNRDVLALDKERCDLIIEKVKRENKIS